MPSCDGFPECPVAKLLGRNKHDGGVSKPDFLKRCRSFRHGDQAVDRGCGGEACLLHPGDLIRHQRDERREHDGKGAGVVMAYKCRKLIAQRLAGARGKDAQQVLAGKVAGCDQTLKAFAVRPLRPCLELVEAEVALQCLSGVKVPRAPGAVRFAAMRHSKSVCQQTWPKLVFDVGRNDRVAACLRKPGQKICDSKSACVPEQV